MRKALAHRGYRRLLSAFAVSQTGDHIYGVGLAVYVLQTTGSTALVGTAMVVRLLPYVFLSSFAGVIADRMERRRLLVICDLARATAMGGLALVAAFDLPIALAFVCTFTSTVFSTPYNPAALAATPDLVPERDLAAANGALNVVDYVTMLVGPALGGLLLLAGEPWLAFAVNSATFVVAAAFVRRLPPRSTPSGDGDAADEPEPSFLTQWKDGLRAVASSAAVMAVVIALVALTFVYGFELVLYVLVAEERLGTGEAGVGFLVAAVGVGGLLGSTVSGRLGRSRRPGRALALIMVITGAPVMLLAVITEPWVAYTVLLLEGIGSVTLDVVATTLLQRGAAAEVRGRVFGIVDSLAVLGIVAGSGVTPVIEGAIGLEWTLVLAGGLLPALALVFAPAFLRLDRSIAAEHERLAPRVAWLESLGIFEGATSSSLEVMAREAVDVDVAEGETVVAEGEPAEHLYLVVSGAFDVLGPSGDRVNTMGDGDWFGEIGILEKRPRTATVVATAPSTVVRIPADAFEEAVTGTPQLPASLANGVVTRLSRTHPTDTLRWSRHDPSPVDGS